MAAYRIDRMEEPQILEEKAVKKPKWFRGGIKILEPSDAVEEMTEMGKLCCKTE